MNAEAARERGKHPGAGRREGAFTTLLLALIVATGSARSEDVPEEKEARTVSLGSFEISTDTGEDPQSKLWLHSGAWWAVLPSDSVSPPGTCLWRLEPDRRWSPVLRLADSTRARADAKASGSLAHILLISGSEAELVSLEFAAEESAYRLWSRRPEPTSLFLPRANTATIDIDSSGRMWLATTAGRQVVVYHCAPPYSSFAGPIALADDISYDDISVVVALPTGAVGVMWSNQRTQRYGFRSHEDGADPGRWSDDEKPASQSALDAGSGMADNHLNVAVASDGTLYAAVKTSYHRSDLPVVALLVRRPDRRWDDLHEVDRFGSRAVVLLNEYTDRLRVIYTIEERSDTVVFKESSRLSVHFGPRQDLMKGELEDVTSTKQNWTDQVVILACDDDSARGVLMVQKVTRREERSPLLVVVPLLVLLAGASLCLWKFRGRSAS